MNLKDILLAKLNAAKNATPFVEDTTTHNLDYEDDWDDSITKEQEEKNESDKTYREQRSQQDEGINYYLSNIPIPDRTLFLATYAPYIRDPYSYNWKHHIDYKDFILGGSTYVLNTFKQLDIDTIYSYYLSYNPPSNLREASLLCFFLNNLHLVMPGFYQKDIEKLILEGEYIKKFKFDKNPELR